MTQPYVMDTLNHTAYEGRFALKTYSDPRGLMPAESAILESLRPRIIGKTLLDIGVGGGRTTPFLLEMSRDYTAIDYSEGLVQQVKGKFGLDSVYCCDVRDMSRFPDDRFDFILFSFNGLDCIAHEGRLKALGEIRRVLKRGGVFLFSSHNRAVIDEAHRAAAGGFRYSVATSLRRKIWKVLLTPRRFRLRRHEMATSEYAIVNDSGLRYSLLLYYISIRSQIDQLKKMEFSVEGMYDMQGDPADHGDRSPWIHYLVTK